MEGFNERKIREAPASDRGVDERTPLHQRFRRQIFDIKNERVTVENINKYGDKTVFSLITLVDQVKEAYASAKGVENEGTAEFEDQAFRYFRLEGVQDLLDRAINKAAQIQSLDRYLGEKLHRIDSVITPPDDLEVDITPGNGSFEAKKLVPRLKTLLYILSELGITEEQVTLTEGKVTKEMMRNTSYISVSISDLNRLVLLCEEEGNASYVFDLNNVDVKKVNDMTKQEKNKLIDENPSIGVRIIQNHAWREMVEGYLVEDIPAIKTREAEQDQIETSTQRREVATGELDPWKGFWTNPETGKHWGTRRQILIKLNVSYGVLKSRPIKNVLEPKTVIDSTNRERGAYCIEDVIKLYPELKEERVEIELDGEWKGFYIDEQGRHWGTLYGLADKIGYSRNFVQRLVDKNNIVGKSFYSTTGNKRIYYSIEDIMATSEFTDIENSPQVNIEGEWEGFYVDLDGSKWGSVLAISKRVNISPVTIHKYIESLESKNVRTSANNLELMYRLNDVLNTEEIAEQLNAPQVALEGEWKRFFTDETGKHWSTSLQIGQKTDQGVHKIRKFIRKHRDQISTIRCKDNRGTIRTMYCLEQIQRLLQ